MKKNIDFLTKEIFVKIITKGLNIFRIIYLLYFFGVSSKLDDFFFSKSIVGLIIFVIMLIEINYSSQINEHKNNFAFLRSFWIVLNKFLFFFCVTLIIAALFLASDIQIMSHVILLSIWGVLNVNSNYFLLILRYQNKNTKVLLYYLLIAVFDFTLVYSLLNFFSISNNYIFISSSILIAELLAILILFSKDIILINNKGKEGKGMLVDFQKKNLLAITIILVLIGLIEISDRYFLSLLGEGSITYYIYGLHAPLMIRQSLDIRTNFFVQLNVAKRFNDAKSIFFNTLKKLAPFYLIGTIMVILCVNFLENFIVNLLKIDNFTLLKNIIYFGLIITPFYMVWDLFYRFYYRQNEIKKLLLYVVLGFLINIVLNYVLAIQLHFDIYGILVSTLAVFIFFNLAGYFVFFQRGKLIDEK